MFEKNTRDENQVFASVFRMNLVGVCDKVVLELIFKLEKGQIKFCVPHNLCNSLRELGMLQL